MAILADASAASLHPFVTGHVAPGATVITDAWQGYSGIDKRRVRPTEGHDLLALLARRRPGQHNPASHTQTTTGERHPLAVFPALAHTTPLACSNGSSEVMKL